MAGLSRAYKRRGNMVANTGGPIMCLDAGSRLSYPGSGTTWTDLSGNGNNVSLNNGAGYDGKSLIYNGTTQSTNVDLPALKTTSISFSAWFNQTKAYSGGDLIVLAGITDGVGWRYGSNFSIGNGVFFGVANGTNYGVSIPVTLNVWVHVVGTFSGGTLNMYKNGILAVSGSGGISYVASNMFNIAWGGPGYDGNSYFGGSIGQTTIYNRALSAAEVKTNFDLTRGRYGI